MRIFQLNSRVLGLFSIRLSFSVWLCLSRLSTVAKWVKNFLFLKNTHTKSVEARAWKEPLNNTKWWMKLGSWEASVRMLWKQAAKMFDFCYQHHCSDHRNQGKLQYIATELQFQAERAARRASIYKRHKQAKLFCTMQQWFFPCQLRLQNQLSRREKGNYIKLQVNSLASETFLLVALFTGIEEKEPTKPISDSSPLKWGEHAVQDWPRQSSHYFTVSTFPF